MTSALEVELAPRILLLPLSLWLLLGSSVIALTPTEEASFSNSGAFGGRVSLSTDNGYHQLTTNTLPDHAWQPVRLPYEPKPHAWNLSVPITPKLLSDDEVQCTGGLVGYATNGVPINSPVALEGKNALGGSTKVTLDDCGGHPTPDDEYHYHGLAEDSGADCGGAPLRQTRNQPQFLGVALDGFPIYSEWTGLVISELDRCHGLLHDFEDGHGPRYAYIMSHVCPYSITCFRGQPLIEPTAAKCKGMPAESICSCPHGIVTPCEELTQSDACWNDTN